MATSRRVMARAGGSRPRARSRSTPGRRACAAATRRGRRWSWWGRTSACPRPPRGCSRRSTAAPGSAASRLEQVELLGRQRHVARRPGAPGAGGGRSRDRPTTTTGSGSRPALGHAPHDRVDPRDQLPQPERLDHVVVGAQLQADHAVHLLALGRDHDDRHARPGPQLARDGVAVDVGQPQVQQHQVRLGRGEGGGAGGDPLHLEALAAQAGRPAAAAMPSSSSTTRSLMERSCRPPRRAGSDLPFLYQSPEQSVRRLTPPATPGSYGLSRPHDWGGAR